MIEHGITGFTTDWSVENIPGAFDLAQRHENASSGHDDIESIAAQPRSVVRRMDARFGVTETGADRRAHAEIILS